MKYYTFYRENNRFDDIVKDPVLGKYLTTRLYWHQHLHAGIDDYQSGDQVLSYLMLKYSDDLLKSPLCPDRTPVEGRDYTATRKPQKS